MECIDEKLAKENALVFRELLADYVKLYNAVDYINRHNGIDQNLAAFVGLKQLLGDKVAT
jgi:hypothetical protein